MNFWEKPEINVILVSLWLFPFFVYYCIRDIFLKMLPKKYRQQKDIRQQIVLITGAGSGIGREMAIEFSKYSTILVLVDLNDTALYETEKMLECSSKCFMYKCDLSKRENVYEMAEKIKKEVGKVNILINNAGIVNGKLFLDLPDEAIIKTMEVNTLAHFWMLKAFLPEMMEYNDGHIVCIASQAGLSGFSRLTDYCASKFAAVGLMESLQRELEVKELDGVKTTIVSPGLVSTGLFEGSGTPLTAFLKPDYVAREVVNAVLENKEVLMLPRWNVFTLILKLILPSQATRDFYKYIKMDFMNTFKGRTKNDNMGNNQH